MVDNNKQAPTCMDIQTLSFAGAGLVASLTLLAVQLVLQVALCRTDPAPLIVCTLLVFIFVKALGLFGSSGGIMDRIARGIMAAGAAMLTPEGHARPAAPPAAQPKKDDKKPEGDKQEDKKNGDNKNGDNKNGDNKNGDKKNGDNKNGDNKNGDKKSNGGEQKKDEKKDGEDKKDEKKDGKKEEKSGDDEITKIVKKYLEQLKHCKVPPAPAPTPAPAPAPQEPKKEAPKKEEPKKEEPKKKCPQRSPPGQPDACWKDGKRRVKTWISKDPDCWNCDCGNGK